MAIADKKKAVKLLNEIMAIAVFMGTPAFIVNETELANVKINLEKKTIIQAVATTNSIRTKFFEEISRQNQITDYRTRFLPKEIK